MQLPIIITKFITLIFIITISSPQLNKSLLIPHLPKVASIFPQKIANKKKAI